MNIAQSDDNTFAITDVTLKELTILWHLFNRGNQLSLKDYYSANFDTNTTSNRYGWANIVQHKKTYNNKVIDLLTNIPYMEMTLVDESLYRIINEYLADLDEPLLDDDPMKSMPTQTQPKPKKKATKTKKLPATDPCALDPGKPASDLYDQYFSGGGNAWGGINEKALKEMADKLMRSLGVEPIDTNAKGQTLIDTVAEITKEKNTKWTTPRTSSKRGKKNNNK